MSSPVDKSNMDIFIHKLWHNFFKWTIDQIPNYYSDALTTIKNQFFQFQWYRVYDFIEFIILNRPNDIRDIEKFPTACNKVLEEENSAYRLIEGKFVQITSENEIQEIEKLLQYSE